MSRRLPTCAWCGERLRGAKVRVTYQDLPGAPEVGWHADTEGVDRRRGPLKRCWDEDPMFQALMDSRDERDDAETEGHVRTIQTRGEDRVSARRAWHDHLLLTAVPLWSELSGVGCIVVRVDGHWVTTACGHWRTGDATARLPRRRCIACVGRLKRGELVPAARDGDGDASKAQQPKTPPRDLSGSAP